MKRTTLDLLACPFCHEGLDGIGGDEGPLHAGVLTCSRCKKDYPILDGIPRFVQPETLTGFNRRFARMYDWFSWGYRAFSKIAFAYIGLDEDTGRREITDRLEPCGGRVLEVSIGSGARILIADETEKGAQGYEKFIPGFKKSFGGKRKEIIPPLDLVPETMAETRVFDVWKGWFYCIEFRKP